MLTQPVFISRCSLTVCRRLISGRNIKTLLSARPELSNAFLIGRFGMDIVRQNLSFPVSRCSPVIMKEPRYPQAAVIFVC